MRPEARLRALFEAAVAAANPARAMAALDLDLDRVTTIAVGKAGRSMAEAARARYAIERGLLVVPARDAGPLDGFETIAAGHPVPDNGSLAAGEKALRLAEELGEGDTLLFLVSGGASALMEALPEPLSLSDLKAFTQALLRSGLPIGDMNRLRRRLSRVKGGRLAIAASPARVVTLAVSDVPGDRLSDIGSGPTLPAPLEDATAAPGLARLGVLPPNVAACLSDPANSPPAGHPALVAPEAILVGSATLALDAAESAARGMGYRTCRLGDTLEGDAHALGAAHARRLIEEAARGDPVLLISGGETSVALNGATPGGRNKAYALAAALALEGRAHCYGLAADSDGIDGTTEDAGAWFGPETLEFARAAGVEPMAALEGTDSYSVFKAAGTLVETGPTGTNVSDIRLLAFDPRG